MTGISFFGGYIPVYRLKRDVIADIWGRHSLGGERSVANNDEDAITMAVEASRNCLKGAPTAEIDALLFGTTSSVFKEKMNAALISAAIDLKENISTLDFTNSLRSGTGALMAALDKVKSGSAKNVLVTCSDCRLGYPRSDEEQLFGDGAAALVVGDENVVATFEGHYCVSNEMMDVWRNSNDTFVRTWEKRFILGEGYINNMKRAIKGLLEKYGLEPKDISKAIFPAPDSRSHKRLASQLGFDLKTQVQDTLLSKLGHCGAAHALLMLVGALEDARPGERLLLACYGDGADAMLFTVTDAIERKMLQYTLRAQLEEKLMLPSYARFLSYKGLVETVPGEPFRLMPSATVTWRDRKSIIRCHGSRCNSCGLTTFPMQRICYNCGSKDDFTEVRIADLEGLVYTFTLDNLAGRSDDPVVPQIIAEFGGSKVRFYGMMTDCDPEEIKVGMPVRLVFRWIYEGAGMPNYFWKCSPMRNGGNDL